MYTQGVTINVIRIDGEITCAIPLYQSLKNEDDDVSVIVVTFINSQCINDDKNTKFRNQGKNIEIGQFGCIIEPQWTRQRQLQMFGEKNIYEFS